MVALFPGSVVDVGFHASTQPTVSLETVVFYFQQREDGYPSGFDIIINATNIILSPFIPPKGMIGLFEVNLPNPQM